MSFSPLIEFYILFSVKFGPFNPLFTLIHFLPPLSLHKFFYCCICQRRKIPLIQIFTQNYPKSSISEFLCREFPEKILIPSFRKSKTRLVHPVIFVPLNSSFKHLCIHPKFPKNFPGFPKILIFIPP